MEIWLFCSSTFTTLPHPRSFYFWFIGRILTTTLIASLIEDLSIEIIMIDIFHFKNDNIYSLHEVLGAFGAVIYFCHRKKR